jgi:hypothetical protein
MESTTVWIGVYLVLGSVALLTLFRAWVVRGDWTQTDRWRTTALVVACVCTLLHTSDLAGVEMAQSAEFGVVGLGVLAAVAFCCLQFTERVRPV